MGKCLNDQLDLPTRFTNTNKRSIELNCGLSSYKEFVGTNLNPVVVELADNHDYLADIIGVNGILRTSDNFIVITKRAEWVGEHPGMLGTRILNFS